MLIFAGCRMRVSDDAQHLRVLLTAKCRPEKAIPHLPAAFRSWQVYGHSVPACRLAGETQKPWIPWRSCPAQVGHRSGPQWAISVTRH